MTTRAPRKRPAPKTVAATKTPRAHVSRWVVDDYLSYLLSQASQAVAARFHVEVRKAGLTILEWRVLATLSDGRSRTVGEVALIVLAKQSTITKLLGRMEADGRVGRSASEVDRRQSLVRITPIGRAALGPLLTKSKQHERTIIARLNARESASLKNALRKLMADD